MLLSTPAYDPTFSAADFALHDVVSGETVSLATTDMSNGFVVVFMCNHCPYVHAILNDLVSAAATLQAEGIPTFAIMSNNYDFVPADSPDNMKVLATEHNFSFPYLVDEDQSIAKAYDAICTPDIFGFNNEKQMQYRGHVTGLVAAMRTIKATGVAPTDYQASSGCSIKW